MSIVSMSSAGELMKMENALSLDVHG